jgi:hypothetical protein
MEAVIATIIGLMVISFFVYITVSRNDTEGSGTTPDSRDDDAG